MTKFIHLVGFLVLLTGSLEAKELNIESFVSAYNKAFQPYQKGKTEKAVANFQNLFSQNVVDVHVAYNVTVEGNTKLAQGITDYTKRMKRYTVTAEQIHWNDYFAALVIKEDSEYLKQGKPRAYKGETFLLLEFDDEGLIKHIRRYHQ